MRILIFVLSVFLASCAVHTQESLSQPMYQILTAYIGGEVFKVQKTSDVPGVFGKADVFGGKVSRGYTELRYKGLGADRKLHFILNEAISHHAPTGTTEVFSAKSTQLSIDPTKKEFTVANIHIVIISALPTLFTYRIEN